MKKILLSLLIVSVSVICKESGGGKYSKKEYKAQQVVVKLAQTTAKKLPDKKGIYAVMNTTAGDMVFDLYYNDAPNTVQNFIDLAQGEKEFTDNAGVKVKKPFYNGLLFHRVIENFMAQGGCPKGDGTGGPGYSFDDEINGVALGLDKMIVKDSPYYQRHAQQMVISELGIRSQEEFEKRKSEYLARIKEVIELPVIEVLHGSGYRYNEVVNSHRAVRGSLAMANSGPNTNGSQFFINQVETPHLDGLHTVFGQLVEGEDVLDKIISLGNSRTKIRNVVIVDKR